MEDYKDLILYFCNLFPKKTESNKEKDKVFCDNHLSIKKSEKNGKRLV
jgi:hypothetical protein